MSLFWRLVLAPFLRYELASLDVTRINLSKVFPFFGKIVERENGRDGADRDTSAAVDELYRDDKSCETSSNAGRLSS